MSDTFGASIPLAVKAPRIATRHILHVSPTLSPLSSLTINANVHVNHLHRKCQTPISHPGDPPILRINLCGEQILTDAMFIVTATEIKMLNVVKQSQFG